MFNTSGTVDLFVLFVDKSGAPVDNYLTGARKITNFASGMKAMESSQSHSRQWLVPLAHLLCLIILFVLPEVMLAIARPHRAGFVFYPGFYVKTLIYIAAFYLNYFLIVDRTLGRPNGRRRILYFILLNLLIIVVGLVVSYFVSKFFATPGRPHRRPSSEWADMLKFTSFVFRDAVMLILTIGLAVALRLSAKWKDIEERNRSLADAQRATELAGLKSQLNPHFLFNTLNTIYALVDISPDDAKKAVHRLSALLRYMLYEDVRSVSLRREADFISDYVSLMRLRLADRPVEVDIDLDGYADTEIPPLLFIPLVENAFKYGTSAPDNTPVSVSLKVDAGSRTVVCRTVNSFVPRTDTAERTSGGIGLANLRRRLQLIYGGKASLKISVRGDIYRACLQIPLGAGDADVLPDIPCQSDKTDTI